MTQDLDLTKIDTLSDDELAHILPQMGAMQNWLQAIEDRAIDRMSAGHDIPGYKLVAGRAYRHWADEEAATKSLRKALKTSDLYTKKLISPAQAEKLLGKDHKLVAPHICRAPGKPILVPIADKRQTLKKPLEKTVAAPKLAA